ncbi:hypothetical protein C2E23DRAFT_539486 [Lenzites betulinus]|nr:hypothetical protein C2E23DRAFT_539486 [Lenzites betulinus]
MDRSTACCDVRLDRAVERAQALLAELSSLLDHVTSCRHVLDVQKLQELHAQAVQTGACVRNLFNTTLTVNRLPAEVLSHVFSFLPRKLRLSIAGTELGNATSVTSLLPALSVCRLWRNVALDTSSLWNTVIESRSRYHLVRQNFAKRCLGGPLHVIAIPLPRSSRLLDTVHAQASRIQELRLKIGDVSVSVQVLLLSMPALLHCCIGGYQHEVRPANKHVVRKTFPLLPDSSGSLRTLRLECTPFIPRTAFTRLTSFQLVGVGCSYRLTLFLAFLAGTPNLRYVQLDHMAFIAPRTM